MMFIQDQHLDDGEDLRSGLQQVHEPFGILRRADSGVHFPIETRLDVHLDVLAGPGEDGHVVDGDFVYDCIENLEWEVE